MWKCIVLLYAVMLAAAPPSATRSKDTADMDRIPNCGVASTFGILTLYGRDVELTELESRFYALRPGVDLAALSLADLEAVIESFGLHARAVRIDDASIESIPTPAILYLARGGAATETGIGHFAILEGSRPPLIDVVDLTFPAGFAGAARKTIPVAALRSIWKGEALLVSTDPIVVPTWLGNRVAWLSTLVLGAIAGVMLFAIVLRHTRADS